jgi:gamma-glutamyltranspeptidase
MSSLGATGSSWAIATPHALATDAGAVAFERGGNAIDAALAAATTLAVTYPHMCGVGGDLFAVVQRADRDVYAVNSSGRLPAAADPEAVRAAHDHVPERGPIPITVPGAVAGWEALHGQGASLPWKDLFGQAIALAFGGVRVSRSLEAELAYGAETLAADPGLRDVFFDDEGPAGLGDQVVQPALGATLQAIASGGAETLYREEVGRRYVEGLRAAGSPVTAEDLAAHEAQVLPPLKGSFGDLHLSVAPPNSQGFVLLQILALIERMELDPDPFGPDAPTLARIALATAGDRDRHLADADAMTTHAGVLLDDGHLASLADEVRGVDPTGPAPSETSGDTIALVAASADGTAVSLIQSLYHGFGAAILEPSTGIVAHDRGACFVLDPAHPNAFTPGRRPAHTLLPVLIHDERGLAGAAGTMGGHAQPQIDAQTIVRSFALGNAPAAAVAAPRWLMGGMDPVASDRPWIRAEARVPAGVVEALQGGGFRVDTVADHDEGVGHAHLIRVGPSGLEAGSDPRADGAAAAG